MLPHVRRKAVEAEAHELHQQHPPPPTHTQQHLGPQPIDRIQTEASYITTHTPVEAWVFPLVGAGGGR